MKQGSRARHQQRYRRFASGSIGAVSSGSNGDLTDALAAMAESSNGRMGDPPAPALLAQDPPDPPKSAQPEARAPRPHVEDDFFARGDEIESYPPASVDTPHVEAEEVVHRPISPRVIARRARMRRIVAGGISTAAVLTLLVVARAWFGRAAPAPVGDSVLSVQSRVVPSIAITAPQEPAAPPVAAAAAPEKAEPIDPPAAPSARRRLPVVDIETPSAPDDATDRAWEKAAKSLSSQDFTGADKAFAELGRSADVATREAARLARALWWMSHGKEAEVRPVLADLAAHATTPYVQSRARELSRTN
jgi:hypothetical protein